MGFKTYLIETEDYSEEELTELLSSLYRAQKGMETLQNKFPSLKNLIKRNKYIIESVRDIYKERFPDRILDNKLYFERRF